MASEAIGDNMYMDIGVIRVADFNSEVILHLRMIGGCHGLRGH